MAIYPVFAQYKPPTRCATAFDTTQYNLTWDEIFTLSTNTPSCQGYDQDDSSECNYCNYTDTALQDCDDKTYEGFLKGGVDIVPEVGQLPVIFIFAGH